MSLESHSQNKHSGQVTAHKVHLNKVIKKIYKPITSTTSADVVTKLKPNIRSNVSKCAYYRP